MKKLIIPLCIAVAVIGGIYGIKHFVRVDTGKVGVVYSMSGGVQAQQQTQQAQAEQEKIKVENATKLLEAQNAAEIEKTKAEAEASANRTVAASITDGLIRMKEAEAREKHGWITVQGADTVVTNGDSN